MGSLTSPGGATNSSPFRFMKSAPSSCDRVPGFIPFSNPVPPRSNSPRLTFNSPTMEAITMESAPAKENVCVTVRFRPLSMREIQKGDEIAWYADGDTHVRNEYNPATGYAYDKVFGPTTTTRGVYDIAAHHVVRGAMEGINGTVFAYGVTSSGKTHTMHGDQKSPGIIPLAIKDVFNIIHETVGRDFLLRVSYLEIYNEVINDLLDPTSQNLRIREDAQGTYVEGIKEEVVVSPAHALSLIAAGEEHRHVGSNNFNLFSSRSHTIFTLTVESSSQGDNFDEVTLSQLNLIDLAGSESSKTDTTGLRRKEGSYINKSLLTLGTVISKLTENKSSHIPYRDSKLTRLLQSSLSGHGRVSLICTITPASSNMEETHNTLKFAYRAKRMELHTNSNRIMDDKSLIKKYQRQIASMKQELDRMRRGGFISGGQEDLLALKQKLEAGQVKMQSRLEEEEQAKAALMGRIQRLTKLILVSTKNTILMPVPEKTSSRRRHSFGEDELAYLPMKKRDGIIDMDDDQDEESGSQGKYGNSKDYKKSRKRSMLSWFKSRKPDAVNGNSVACPENENNSNESPTAPSSCPENENNSNASPTAPSSPCSDSQAELQNDHYKFESKKSDEMVPFAETFPAPTQAGELFSVIRHGRKPPPTGTTITDQMDLIREQMKMVAGEVALSMSSLKRLSEQLANNPDDTQMKGQVLKMEEDITEKKQQLDILRQRMIAMGADSVDDASLIELQQNIASLTNQLDQKQFELEIKTADNRVLQEQLQAKLAENEEAYETILQLREQLAMALEKSSCQSTTTDEYFSEVTEQNVYSNGFRKLEPILTDYNRDCSEELRGQMLLQAAEVEQLKQEKDQLLEEKEGLQIQGQKLAEEASYAKELAAVAAEQLKTLAEEASVENTKLAKEVAELSFQNTKLAKEVAELSFQNTKLLEDIANISFQNTKLAKELETVHSLSFTSSMINALPTNGFSNVAHVKHDQHDEIIDDIDSWSLDPEDMKNELHARKEREAMLEAKLSEKEQKEEELLRRIEERSKREADLENDLAGMWVLVANLKKEKGISVEVIENDAQHVKPVNNNLGNLNYESDVVERELKREGDTKEDAAIGLENERLVGPVENGYMSQSKEDHIQIDHFTIDRV